MITLRAHHLLCLLNFHGLGYSEEFIKNMRRIVAKLKDNPIIIVTDKCDEICQECPYMMSSLIPPPPPLEKGGKSDVPPFVKGGKGGFDDLSCNRYLHAEKNVHRHDRAVLKVLKINSGDKFNADELYKKVTVKMPSLKRLCKTCQWHVTCHINYS